MNRVMPEALSPQAFAPFGRVLDAPASPGRTYFDQELESRRAHAHPSLSLVHNEPVQGTELQFTRLECHRHSSQSFVPMNARRWLVVVAPDVEGRPDVQQARAFVADASQGITYFPGTWHLGLHVLDAPSTHAIFMWCDGSAEDETFVDVVPTTIHLQDLPELKDHA